MMIHVGVLIAVVAPLAVLTLILGVKVHRLANPPPFVRCDHCQWEHFCGKTLPCTLKNMNLSDGKHLLRPRPMPAHLGAGVREGVVKKTINDGPTYPRPAPPIIHR